MASESRVSAPGGRLGALLDLALWFVALGVGLGALALATRWHVGEELLLRTAAPLHMAFLIAVTTVLLRRRGERWRDLGLARPTLSGWRTAGLIVAGYVAGMGFNALCVLAIFPALGMDRPDISAIGDLKGHPGAYVYMLLVAWSSAALGEELQFRGFVWSRLERLAGGGRLGTVVALVGQAVLFSLGHVYQGLAGIIVTGALGLVLGGVYLAGRRNLVACMILHGLIDGISLTLLFLVGAKALQAGP